MFFRISVIFCFLTMALASFGQKLEGVVLDKSSKEPIPYSTLYFIDLDLGIVADSSGKFKFEGSLPKVTRVKVSSIGYSASVFTLETVASKIHELELETSHIQLDEIIVSSPSGVIQRQTIANVETRKVSELNSISATSLGEAISNMPGVYQASSGVGISKPVIRGLSGNRVVTYLNGLRIENQQWGGDHGMGVSEIGIGSVEVIKGPSSLLYGADALGGVLYFVDEPYSNHNQNEGFFQTKVESNTLGLSSLIGIKSSKKNLRVNLFAGYSNHGDYQIPNRNYVINSRFSGTNFKTSIGYNKKNWIFNLRYNYSESWIGIVGETEDSVVSPLSFQSNTQERMRDLPSQFVQNHYLLTENKFYLKNNELFFYIGKTNNSLSEFEDEFDIPAMHMTLGNTNYNTVLKTKWATYFQTVLGFQGMYQRNENAENAEERLIPDAITYDNGLYGLLKVTYGNWNAEGGIRYDNRLLQTLEVFNGMSKLHNRYESFNYSFGVSRTTEQSSLRGNVSSGFRAPHSSELLADGVHHGSVRYEVGNVNLKSEKATQFDVSYELRSEHLELIVNPFYNRIQDYIYINPTGEIREGYKVFAYTQADFVQLRGGDVGFHYHPHIIADELHFESSYSYVRADDNFGNAIPMIPQSRINSSLKFEFDSKSSLKLENIVLQHQYFFEQINTAIFETNSPAYNLFNLGINLKSDGRLPLSISTGVKNIFNTEYISHLSGLKNIGISNPGRNIYLSIQVDLDSKTKR